MTVGLLSFGTAPTGVTSFQTVALGGGGQIEGLDTDVGGAYLWDSFRWRQLLTPTSMPSPFNSAPGLLGGVWDIQIAHSQTSTFYMVNYNDNFFPKFIALSIPILACINGPVPSAAMITASPAAIQ